jgi:hypothetical protein
LTTSPVSKSLKAVTDAKADPSLDDNAKDTASTKLDPFYVPWEEWNAADHELADLVMAVALEQQRQVVAPLSAQAAAEIILPALMSGDEKQLRLAMRTVEARGGRLARSSDH